MFHHTAHTLQDKFIGYPETFVEPPLGYYINQQFAVQVAKADTHRFTLYHTDFLPGTDRFSPIGASRFNLMYTRLADWSGPIFVEWTPDQPELAESRRQAILATLAAAGQPMLADRVVIGPSPYPGAMGVDAANNFANTIIRSQMRRRASRCRRTTPPRWASADMTHRGDRRRISVRGSSDRIWNRESDAGAGPPDGRVRALGAGLAVTALVGGCARATAAAAARAPPARRSRRRSDDVGRPEPGGRRQSPRSTRRRPSGSSSRCTSTSARSSSPRQPGPRPCRSIRTRSRSPRTKAGRRSGGR